YRWRSAPSYWLPQSWIGLRRGLVSEAKEAGAVPFAAGDREGNPGQVVIGLAVPDKARIHHHDPMALTVPRARQDGAGLEVDAPAIELRSQARGIDCAAIAADLLQQANRVKRQIPECARLKPIGQDGKQKMARQMQRRLASEYTLPACAQSFAIALPESAHPPLPPRLGRA